MMPFWLRSIFSKFWSHLTWKYIVILFLCLWALSVQMTYRVPSRFLFLLLPWVGLAVSVLSFILLGNHLLRLVRVPADDPFIETFRRIERWTTLLIGAFLCYSLFLYANGRLDSSEPVDHSTEILTISGGEIDLGWLIPYSWTEFRSWEDPERTERLFLQWRERDVLWAGAEVVVQIRKGYFGLPWVLTIERDEEKNNLQVLRLVPTASAAWRQLITHYFIHHRPKEASAAAREYLKIYPNDLQFAGYVGAMLNEFGRYAEAVTVFEHVLARRPGYGDYVELGRAVYLQGNKTRAAAAWEAAIRLSPESPIAYYHLGYLYKEVGELQKAVGTFEKLMKRTPGFPEVEAEIANLRQVIQAQPSGGESK